MKYIKIAIMTVGIIMGLNAVIPVTANASLFPDCDGTTEICGNGDNNGDIQTIIKKIVNVMMFIIGAVAVIMIVYSGFKYVTSSGDAAAVASAKSTLIYSIVGLAVAILAYAIVNFVITSFTS
jgi:heme/copper-type cytochrome/quinol oxidase subunit 2